jgi:type I restriction enzyme M protein
MNKQQLASKIWDSANKMRSKIEAGEYKDYILGFMFYKFLSDKELKFLKEKDFTDDDIKNLDVKDLETVTFLQEGIGYYISYENLFSTWIDKGSDFDVSNVRDALLAFDRLIGNSHKKVFDRVFNTLQTGLSKLGGTTAEQTKSIRELVHLLKIIPMDERQDYDVLGFIYEYLISNFAVNAGKKAGEFYTPHEVSLLMSEIVAEHLKDRKRIKIYDPTSGSGSLLINIGHSISKHMTEKNNIKYYAQELKENTYNLTRMNLIMRGILPDNIAVRNADTLETDWPYFDDSDPTNTYDPLYVDAVVSNPPYSQKWDSIDKETDPRYAEFGIAPKSKADYAFLLHDLYHVKPDGIMTIVLPHGVLFRGGEEGQIRKKLIEKNHIDAIIGLPANIFFGTGIPTIVIVLKQNRDNNDIQIIDASKGFIKVGSKNELQASDIKKIVDTVISRENIDKYSRVVPLTEIRDNDYNLNIPRYVDSSPASESWDLYSLMFGGIPKEELKDLKDYWDVFPSLKEELFDNINDSYVSVKSENPKQLLQDNKDVQSYLSAYQSEFDDFEHMLHRRLIDDMMDLNIADEENEISNIIFNKLELFNLIDKYKGYQALNNEWVKISIDLEILQSEGFQASKHVDPFMVIKKKSNKEVEVQEGWVGRVIPFELVQNTLLKSEVNALRDKEERIVQIQSEIQELIDSLSDEEKELVLNDAATAFNAKSIKEQLKELDDTIESEEILKHTLIQFNSIKNEEKELKKEIKIEEAQLHNKTKITIESLTDEQAKVLLSQKWIDTLINSIKELPQKVLNNLVTRIKLLKEKYNTTLSETDNKIKQEQEALSLLIDELEGNEFDMKGLSELQSLLKGD